jgi:hypothetical protein
MDGTQFVRVKGYPCNSQGIKVNPAIPQEFELNINLISAFQGNNVHLKGGGDFIKLGSSHYRDFKLVDPSWKTENI